MGALIPSPLAWLRANRTYLDARWATREGLPHAWRRRQVQRQILNTPPTRTSPSGPTEVRVLTWRRDCIDVIWALKSFYHFSGVDYPLYIHDGGLTSAQHGLLAQHFPDAQIISATDADSAITFELERRDLSRCLAYRLRNVTTRKLFDFFLLSKRDYLVSIDSDIVFFSEPALLRIPSQGISKNRYNKDEKYWYSLDLDELEANFGIRPLALVNSGLSVIRRESINFESIEEWLRHPKLFEDRWVTEQTLHALCSTRYGIELLPDQYCVSTKPGLTGDMVCKHYPGFFATYITRRAWRISSRAAFSKP